MKKFNHAFAVLVVCICGLAMYGIVMKHHNNFHLDETRQNSQVFITPRDSSLDLENNQLQKQSSKVPPQMICPHFARYNVSICTHPAANDIYISRRLLAGQMWEPVMVELVLTWLRQDPSLALIDIGANIGVFSLVAAAAGRRVLAVEPMPGNVAVMNASIQQSHLENLITIVSKAMSTGQYKVSLTTSIRNRGLTMMNESCTPTPTVLCSNTSTIMLDDLLNVPGFNHRRAVVKMDIEGHELPTLMAGSTFWDKLHIPVLLMEWDWVRKKLNNQSLSIKSVDKFVRFMNSMDYEAFSVKKRKLVPGNYLKWGENMYWMKRSDQNTSYGKDSR